MDLIKAIETPQVKDIADFRVGDTVKVHYRIIEGKNERIQVFEGLCIVCKGAGARKTFTIRKISNGIGVERIFPLYSPKIANIEVVRRGKVRRGRIYYVRSKVGKEAKIKERLPQKGIKSKKTTHVKKEKAVTPKTEDKPEEKSKAAKKAPAKKEARTAKK